MQLTRANMDDNSAPSTSETAPQREAKTDEKVALLQVQVKSGAIFGELTVVSLIANATNRAKIWECLCSCGKSARIRADNLRSGHTKSCGCGRFKPVSIDADVAIGLKFGKLTVRAMIPNDGESGRRMVICSCACGNATQLELRNLRAGHTKSCGCLKLGRPSNVAMKAERAATFVPKIGVTVFAAEHNSKLDYCFGCVPMPAGNRLTTLCARPKVFTGMKGRPTAILVKMLDELDKHGEVAPREGREYIDWIHAVGIYVSDTIGMSGIDVAQKHTDLMFAGFGE